MADNKKNNKTLAWQRYEEGRRYNNSLVPNQYRLVNTNTEFMTGNQWLNLPQSAAMSRLAKPTFNIVKRVAALFVASLTSNATTITFDTLSYNDGENIQDPDTNAAVYATAEVQNLLEKFKMEYRVRDALMDGATTGDYCAHFYWDPDARPYGGAFGSIKGEIQFEMVDGINVMFGNPNTHEAQKQPYILLIGRDTLESLRWEADRWKKRGNGIKSDAEERGFFTDNEYDDQIGVGGETELRNGDDTDKALYVLMYTKTQHEEKVIDPETGLPVQEPDLDDDGRPIYAKDEKGNIIVDLDGNPQYKTHDMTEIVTTVYATKATRDKIIYENVDTGLSLYPIAWGNWERQKNQYHGRALATGIIPNQIFINSMFAMVMRHLQLLGFPKTIYNADLIAQWSTEIGQAIGVHNLSPGQSVREVATNMQPSDMSAQILGCIDKAVALTKECLGATDVQMGNVRPDNTSALMVLQSNSEVPLENVRAGLYEWVEDIGRILLDMMGTYYGERPLIRSREFEELVMDKGGIPKLDPMTGQMMTQKIVRRVKENFDFGQFKNLYLNVRANIGATSYFSEIAMVQTLDNLRREGVIDSIQYLERIPDKLVPRRAELIDALRGAINEENPDQKMIENNPGLAGAIMGGAAENATQQLAAKSGRAMGNGPGVGAAMGKAVDQAKAIEELPPNLSSKFSTLPHTAQESLLKVQGTKR